MGGAAAGDEGGGGYREKYSVYAAAFGASQRTVKRWVEIGRKAGDPPPLDSAVGMRDWWTRRMKQRVPGKILAAAASTEPLLELPVAAGPAPEAPREELAELADGDRGIFQELRRAEERAWHAHQSWLKAMEERNEEKAAFANRQCTLAAENVRRIQKDATEESIRLRNYIPKLEAEQVVAEFGQDLLARISAKGEGMARALGVIYSAEVEARWQAEMDELCAGLQKEVFADEA